jgi:hypothetical protein
MSGRNAACRFSAGTGILVAVLVLCAGVSPVARGEPGLSNDRKRSLERAVRLAEAARRDGLAEENCPFSPAGVVMRVGADPERLAAYVRARIAYEPYPGVVRGPEGTLAAMAGGDWDRAALLRALLAEAGYPSRLVVVPRDEAERSALVDAFLAAQGRERTLGAAGSRVVPNLPEPDPLLARCGVSLPNRRLAASAAVARWQGLLDEAYDAAASVLPVLGDAVGDGRPFDAWRGDLMAGASERVLVEIEGARRLDPGPGRDPDPDAGTVVPEVPADRRATLTLTLAMTVAGEGAPGEPVVLLERTDALSDLFCKPIRFQIAPDASAAGGKPANEWSEEEWHDRLTGFERFQAILEIDRLWTASDAFDLYGRTFRVKGDGRIDAAKDYGSSVNRGFGGFGGGGTREEEKPSTRIGALTLELVLALPGNEPVRARRLLFGDLRKEVSPVFHADMLVLGGPVGPGTALWRAFDAVTSNASFVARVMTSDEPDRLRETPVMRIVARMLHEWQQGRLALADRLLGADEGLGYHGGPVLVSKCAFLVPDPEAKTVRRRTVLDVIFDGQRLVPREEGAAGARAARANAMLGVASTVLESLLVRERRPAADLEGTYAAFERAGVAGEAPVTTRARDLGGVVPTALARWALEANERGRVLVFPSSKVAASWWSVDPVTGFAIGRGGSGEGQSMAEYKAAIETALKNLKCMAGVFQDAAGGGAGDQTGYEWMKCMTDFDPEKPSSYAGAYGKYQEEINDLKMWSWIADRLASVENLIEDAGGGK